MTPANSDSPSTLLPPDDSITGRIYIVRGRRVMLDFDLADLYEVPTKRLNEQVNRNLSRFPEDFLFRLSEDEVAAMRSQIATASGPQRADRRNVRFRPYAFTEHGVTMLSAVLRSERAVAISVAVVRAFVRLREVLAVHTDIAHRVDELEQSSAYHEGQLTLLFDVVHELMSKEPTTDENSDKSRRLIGFHSERVSR